MAMTWQVDGAESGIIRVRGSAVAREWRRFDRMLGPAGQRALDALRLTGKERVLDVCCGTGGITLAAAHRVRAGGCAVGIDMDASAVSVARSRASEQSLAWTTFAVGDPAHFELPSWAFDVIVSRFGISAVARPDKALARLARALVPGGKIAFVCWRAPAENGWFELPRAVVAECFGDQMARALPPTCHGDAPFAFADAERVRDVLTGAGFGDVGVEQVDLPVWLGDDLDDALEFFFETDGRPLDDWLDAKQFERVTIALRRALVQHGRPDGVYLPGSVWLVTGTTPAAAA